MYDRQSPVLRRSFVTIYGYADQPDKQIQDLQFVDLPDRQLDAYTLRTSSQYKMGATSYPSSYRVDSVLIYRTEFGTPERVSAELSDCCPLAPGPRRDCRLIASTGMSPSDGSYSVSRIPC